MKREINIEQGTAVESLPTRERELKPCKPACCNGRLPSLPTRERELKH